MKNSITILFTLFYGLQLIAQIDVAQLQTLYNIDVSEYFTKVSDTTETPEKTNIQKYEGFIENSSSVHHEFLLRLDRSFIPDSSLIKLKSAEYFIAKVFTFYLLRIDPHQNPIRIGFTKSENTNQSPSVFIFAKSEKSLLRLAEDGDIFYNNFLIGRGIFYILIFLNFFNFGGYLITKRKDLLYYGFYTFVVLIFTGLRFFTIPSKLPFGGNLIYELRMFSIFLQPWFYVFYCKFAQHFLDTKKHLINIHKLLNILVWISVSASILMLIFNHFDQNITIVLFTIYRVLALFFGIFIVYVTASSKIKLAKFLVIGTISLLVFSILSMIFGLIKNPVFGLIPLVYFALGYMIEFFFFSLGLAQKSAMETEEKLKIQAELNSSL